MIFGGHNPIFDSPEWTPRQAQATPGLLNALGQTFVSPAAELTPEERKGAAWGKWVIPGGASHVLPMVHPMAGLSWLITENVVVKCGL